MYEALIAHLRECAKIDSSNNTYTEAAEAIEAFQKCLSGVEADNDSLREKLNEAEAKMVSWIPVSEDLPTINEDGFSDEVYVTDGSYIVRADMMLDFCGKADWGYTGIGEITHWCKRIPMPETTKGEKVC